MCQMYILLWNFTVLHMQEGMTDDHVFCKGATNLFVLTSVLVVKRYEFLVVIRDKSARQSQFTIIVKAC